MLGNLVSSCLLSRRRVLMLTSLLNRTLPAARLILIVLPPAIVGLTGLFRLLSNVVNCRRRCLAPGVTATFVLW